MISERNSSWLHRWPKRYGARHRRSPDPRSLTTDPESIMTTDARSQTERVVLTLREMLLRGDFKPGERLTELALVPMLKASRTPVRLALDRLANEGLLEALATTGFRVRAFALDDIWDAIE